MKLLNSSTYQSKVLVAALVAGQTCVFLPLTALAGPVRVAGQQVFNVTTGGSGATVAARTTTIQKNIDNALVASTNHSPNAVAVTYVKGLPVLTLGGFYVATIDGASAKAAKTTPALLAQNWSNGLKAALKNQTSINNYIAQLTTSTTDSTAGTTTTNAGSYPYYQQGRIVYIPAGMQIPVQLTTAISSESARPGDRIEAQIAETVNLGETSIPAGSTVTGTVTESTAGQRLGRSGMLGLKFDTLRTRDGLTTPINAHIVGGIGKYAAIGASSGIVKGESTSNKVKQAAIRGAVGAGSGALLGTAIGAIAGHGGRGAGRGAIAGTAIGGALGVAESLLYRKGSDVQVQSGQTLNLQLDAPASLAISAGQM